MGKSKANHLQHCFSDDPWGDQWAVPMGNGGLAEKSTKSASK